MAATIAVVEPAASRWRRSLDPLRTRMAAVYLPLCLDTQLGRVTHLCPRGPVANGLGSDWCEERDVGRAGLRRVEGADIWRAGPTWAAGQELAVGRQRYADSGHVNDRDNGIFQVTAPILFRVEARPKERPISAPWNPRLHMIQSSVPVSSAAHYQTGTLQEFYAESLLFLIRGVTAR